MSNNLSLEAEKMLLGTILEEGEFHNVRGYIQASDFSDKRHALIFGHLEELKMDINDNFELVDLVQSLISTNDLAKVGGQEYLAELISMAGLKINIAKYIKTIIDYSTIKNIQKVLSQSQKMVEDGTNKPEDIIEKTEDALFEITRNSEVKEFETAAEIAERVLINIEKKSVGELLSGVPTTFSELDDMTGGFQKGDLIILAARPSMGKTAFALNIANNVAKREHVAFFSIEMPSIQIFNRIFSLEGMINGSRIRDPKNLTQIEMKKLYLAKDKASKLRMSVDDTAGIKLSELIWKAKRLHKIKPISLIIIDYLQLITTTHGKGDNRQAEVSIISRQLKQLARELNVPIIALSQLSRRVEQRESKIPLLSDLRESGSIEQDADLICFLYREEYYKNKLKTDEENAKQDHKTDLIIAKHRNGSVGTINFAFNPELGLFIDSFNKRRES